MKEKILLLGFLFGILFSGAAFANGQSPTECELDADACEFTITLNIAFDGGASDSYISDAKTEIEDFWNGQPGSPRTTGECKCTVKFVVNTAKVNDCDKDSGTGWHCIKVTSYKNDPPKDTKGEKYMGYMYPPGISNGGKVMGWWSDQMSREIPGGEEYQHYYDFAHEAGHLMGLEDKDGGIMSDTKPPGAKVTQAHIDEIISDVCTGKTCPDRCCCGDGKVQKDKGEGCDPVATPPGCEATQYCCPYCCQCAGKVCDPKEGEYATKEECAKNCKPGEEGGTVSCVYSFWTGCWICIPEGWESLYPETDSANIRQAGKTSHEEEEHPLPPAPSTLAPDRKEKAKKAVEDLSKSIASSPVLSALMGNERINFYIDGVGEYHSVLATGGIVDTGEGAVDGQTMNFYLDEATLDLLDSEEMSETEALKRELVTYEGVGLVEGFKFWLSDVMFDWFVPYNGPGPGESNEGVTASPEGFCAGGDCGAVDYAAREQWREQEGFGPGGCIGDACEPGGAGVPPTDLPPGWGDEMPEPSGEGESYGEEFPEGWGEGPTDVDYPE